MLLQIKEGHYGNVQLNDISVVITYDLGKWKKFYISQQASDEQVGALQQLVPKYISSLSKGDLLEVKKVPVSFERGESKVKYSVPASTVEMEIMKGTNGKPIKIENVAFQDYTQYKTIIVSHNSDKEKFNYSGTNGLTFNIDATGEK
jgi:hypothetical protein